MISGNPFAGMSQPQIGAQYPNTYLANREAQARASLDAQEAFRQGHAGRSPETDAAVRANVARGLLPGTQFDLVRGGRPGSGGYHVTRGANARPQTASADGRTPSGYAMNTNVVGGAPRPTYAPTQEQLLDRQDANQIQYGRDVEREKMREQMAAGQIDDTNSGNLPRSQAKYGNNYNAPYGAGDAYDSIQRMEAAKQRRNEYLSGTGDFAPKEGQLSSYDQRKADLQSRRDAVTSNARLKGDQRRSRLDQREQMRIDAMRPMTADQMMMMQDPKNAMAMRGQNMNYAIQQRSMELQKQGMDRESADRQSRLEMDRRTSEVQNRNVESDTRMNEKAIETMGNTLTPQESDYYASLQGKAERNELSNRDKEDMKRIEAKMRGNAIRPETAPPAGDAEGSAGTEPATQQAVDDISTRVNTDREFAARWDIPLRDDGTFDEQNMTTDKLIDSMYKFNGTPEPGDMDTLFNAVRSGDEESLKGGMFTPKQTQLNRQALFDAAKGINKDRSVVSEEDARKRFDATRKFMAGRISGADNNPAPTVNGYKLQVDNRPSVGNFGPTGVMETHFQWKKVN